MTNRTLTSVGICAGSLFAAAAQGFAAKPAPKANAKAQQRPNIVIIYTDDMGMGDVSFLNSQWMKSPCIDRIASEGLIVQNYYSAAPISSPSRAGLTSGTFPLQCGITTFLHERAGNARWNQFDYLNPEAPSMARILKEAGYSTGHFGKWHMGGGRDVTDAPAITRYGFDEYVSTYESPDPDPLITGNPKWIWSDKDSIKRWDRTAYFVDKTLDFLSRHKGEPCFVNLWPDDMHTPWVPDEESMVEKKYESQVNFMEVMTEYDRQLGRFLDGLAKLGLDKNTIVIFTSDNGPAPSFQQIRANGQRGAKGSLYEGGIKMPFAIRWPAKIKPGQVDDRSVICSVDLLPSLCAIAGAKLPKGVDFSGEDLHKVLLGKPADRTKDLMWEFGQGARPNPDDHNRSPHLAIRRGNWKLLVNHDDDTKELYDMKADPNETHNVASEHPELVRKLNAKVLEWWAARPVPERSKNLPPQPVKQGKKGKGKAV